MSSEANRLIVLPHSGFRLKVMMYRHWNAVADPQIRGRGILPDHEVAQARC